MELQTDTVTFINELKAQRNQFADEASFARSQVVTLLRQMEALERAISELRAINGAASISPDIDAH